MKKIAIGGDHAGFECKEKLISHLSRLGYTITDFGPNSEASVDYPDYVHPLANSVEAGENTLGIAICGSGNGVAMTANKHAGIRAALCWNKELAALARQHNDANILCIPSRFLSFDTALEMATTFLTEDFEGGRHQKRVDKIPC